MSVRDLLAGYAVTLAVFIFGCLGIERSGIGLKGARWLKTALGVACAGIVMALFRFVGATFLFDRYSASRCLLGAGPDSSGDQ
jgi:hypothetical protein